MSQLRIEPLYSFDNYLMCQVTLPHTGQLIQIEKYCTVAYKLIIWQ